ncbi:hypothetical protein K3495_g3397 [Podosphaera aphanis]|nr:hypothetical protein K3495_g3397 [Podosphaera aphanis]
MTPMSDINAPLTRLFNQYKSTLESTTVLAVVSDYDLTDPAQLEAARNTLDFVKESVSCHNKGSDHCSLKLARSLTDEHRNNTRDNLSARSGRRRSTDDDCPFPSTEPNNVDPAISDFSLDDVTMQDKSLSEGDANAYDGLDEEAKVRLLIEMFPALKSYDIIHAINKCDGNVSLAIDELITLSFLEESGDRYRSIDGFAGRANSPRQKRKKGKRINAKRDINSTEAITPSLTQDQSSWEVGQQNIEFLAEKVRLPKSQVAALFYKCGASLSETISHLTKEHLRVDIRSKDEPTIQAEAHKLSKDFPMINLEQLETLCQITYPDVSNARVLAKSLAPNPILESLHGVQLTIHYAPPNINSETMLLRPKLDNVQSTKPLESKIAVDRVADLREARNTAFAKATAAYRRGKSDHLMGAAATYYAEQGHDYSSRMKKAQSEAADSLVASQSSPTHLDLHGVNVKDAVRITRERVTSWWHELGESRTTNLRHEYKVITGTGTHSEGGKSKIGPAVAKMLIREGWKVEMGTGFLVVTGVVKKN